MYTAHLLPLSVFSLYESGRRLKYVPWPNKSQGTSYIYISFIKKRTPPAPIAPFSGLRPNHGPPYSWKRGFAFTTGATDGSEPGAASGFPYVQPWRLSPLTLLLVYRPVERVWPFGTFHWRPYLRLALKYTFPRARPKPANVGKNGPYPFTVCCPVPTMTSSTAKAVPLPQRGRL